MTNIINQPWEDVASDVTGAIESAVQPLLKKAVDEIYTGLLEATQDYLKDNLAFNIASRIDAAEREAAQSREMVRLLASALDSASGMIDSAEKDTNWSPVPWHEESPTVAFQALIAKARGES